MSLRQLAAADLKSILEDSSGGFGWQVTIQSPSGETAAVLARPNERGVTIDPETGQSVSGTVASVTFRTATLMELGLGLPTGIAETSSRPWRISFVTIDGVLRHYRVRETHPDDTLGLYTCILERYGT